MIQGLRPYAVPHCPGVPSVLVHLTEVSPISWNHIAFQNAYCSSGIGPSKQGRILEHRSALGGRGGWPSPSRERPAAPGLSLLSQVKLWKPQRLITAWHRAPSGFRVACIDLCSLHRTWVWAKFKPCHRQFNSFLWRGNLMVNHNYWYSWYLNSQNNLWRCVEFKSVQLEFHLLIIKYSIIANCAPGSQYFKAEIWGLFLIWLLF